MMMDFEQARFNMVEQQIRTWDVLDRDILDLLFAVRREDFVPESCRALAFADLEIPLGDGERMWTPKLEARVMQAMRMKPHERALEVGTGSGYLTALIASQGTHVTSVEINAKFSRDAKIRLRNAGIRNVEFAVGDGARGWGSAQYDAILLTGSTPLLPSKFVNQLKPGGRLFAVVGDPPVMKARLVRWVGPEDVTSEDLFETVIDPLRNAAAPPRFQF